MTIVVVVFFLLSLTVNRVGAAKFCGCPMEVYKSTMIREEVSVANKH